MLRVRVGIVFFLKIVFDRDVDAPGFPFLGIFFFLRETGYRGGSFMRKPKVKRKDYERQIDNVPYDQSSLGL